MCNRPDYNRFFDFLIVIVIETKFLNVIVIVIVVETKFFKKLIVKNRFFLLINQLFLIKLSLSIINLSLNFTSNFHLIS